MYNIINTASGAAVCDKELEMKKIITVTILILAVCLLCAGTAFADTTSGQTFYIASKDLTVYVYDSGVPQPAFVIPESYYFRVLSTDSSYSEISYAKSDLYTGIKLYVSNNDLGQYAKVTDDKVTDDNAYYNIPVANATPINKDVWLCTPGTLSNESKYSYATINSVLGAYQSGTTTYFAAIVEISEQKSVLLYKAVDTNNADFRIDSIPLHQITVDRNEQQNQGIISTPGSGNTDVTKNNVIRNVMIAVICVLCVLVIFLIFRPTKNAKNRYELENRERAQGGYNNPRYGDPRR